MRRPPRTGSSGNPSHSTTERSRRRFRGAESSTREWSSHSDRDEAHQGREGKRMLLEAATSRSSTAPAGGAGRVRMLEYGDGAGSAQTSNPCTLHTRPPPTLHTATRSTESQPFAAWIGPFGRVVQRANDRVGWLPTEARMARVPRWPRWKTCARSITSNTHAASGHDVHFPARHCTASCWLAGSGSTLMESSDLVTSSRSEDGAFGPNTTWAWKYLPPSSNRMVLVFTPQHSMGPRSGPRSNRAGRGGNVYGSSTWGYSTNVRRTPSGGSAFSAAVGAQSPPLGTGPVPVAKSMRGWASPGAGPVPS